MNIDQAHKTMRDKIESMYEDKCTVYKQKDIWDEKTKVSKKKTVKVISEEPCRLSFSSLQAEQKADPASKPSQTVKLFISPDVDIRPGCKIEIRHKGRIYEYERSGLPAVYYSHQEIVLEPFGRWS